MSTLDSIAIRAAIDSDHQDLVRLAALDGATFPAPPALVAEEDGVIIAALPLPRGRAVADPFRRTAHAVALLELRAEQLMRPARRRGLPLPALRRRRRRAALPAGAQ